MKGELLLVLVIGVAFSHGQLLVQPNRSYVLSNRHFPQPELILSQQNAVMQAADKGTVLEIFCPMVHLGQGPAEMCINRITIVANGVVTPVCDSQEDYYLNTNSQYASFQLRGGPYEPMLVYCIVQARSPNEAQAPTTDKPLYFEERSQEIDSSEAGGPPGAKSTTCNCGRANRKTSRIVGGKETEENKFPFAVALLNKKMNMQFCGGTIITPYHVVTAAHCTNESLSNPEEIYAIAGAHNLQTPTYYERIQAIRTAKIFQHENYQNYINHKGRIIANDIAILQLERALTYNEYVGPACISTTQLNLANKYVKNMGWGKVGHNRAPSPFLKEVNLRVVDLNNCSQVIPAIDPSVPTQICTFGVQKASCMGDSGGPVVWLDPETNRYTLVGAVSFGMICAMKIPTVHTDVTAYYKWIESKVSGNQMCTKI